MKSCFLKTSLLLTALVFSASPVIAKDAEKPSAAKTSVAKTWVADAKGFDGKAIETYVKDIADAGHFPMEAPYVVIPISTADQGGTDGGGILLLVPPADVDKLIASTKPETAKKGSAFGNKIIYKKLSATFRIVGGEPVLVKGGDTTKLDKIGKPSQLLETQLKAAGTDSDTPPSKYPKKNFLASQIGSSGKSETQRELDRLLPLINAKLKAADSKAKPLTSDSLRRALRNGDEFLVDDDSTKTTWRVVWK